MSKDDYAVVTKKRFEWIDALKGLGIILVTMGHLHPWVPVRKHIYSFHICLFFFISGYLYKDPESFGNFVKKQAKSLLLPFIIWDFLSSIVALILGGDPKTVLMAFFTINGELCWNAPLWYLLVLFVTEVLYAAIRKLSRAKIPSLFIALAAVILWVCIGPYMITLKLNLVPLAICFYSLGDFFRHTVEEKNFSKKVIILCIAVTGIISIIFGAILNIRVVYTKAIFGNFFYCIPAAVSGTLFYYLIFKNYVSKGNRLLEYLGRNSLIIMIAQFWFFEIFDYFLKKLFGVSIHDNSDTIKVVVVTILAISVILLCDYIFKRIFRKNEKILKIGTYFGIR